MDGHRFDDLIRSLHVSRRPLLGGGLAVAGGWLSRPHFAASARKKRRKRAKLKRNAFGCVNVGGKCRGKDAACCSGICDGKKPKKGKKDRSKCKAHNVLDCPPGANACGDVVDACGTQPGTCFQTTGGASYCAVNAICTDCKKDTDCGPGGACAVCSGCEISETACLAPAA